MFIFDWISPPDCTEATPVVPSSSFIRVSFTKDESWNTSLSFISTAATMMGIMVGLIFMM